MKDMKNIGLLRKNVHILEKARQENRANPKREESCQNLYVKCKEGLSLKEKRWYESVLFNRSPEIINETDDSFLNLLMSRRSIRKWENQTPLSIESYEKLMAAALWSPSSCNRQPCEFILIQDREKIKKISKIKRQIFIAKAPSCIVVLINRDCYQKDEKYFAGLDAGAAIQNILLMAEHLNLGACWVNASPYEYKENEREELLCTLKIPTSFDIISFITIGYLSQSELMKNPPGRKEIEIKLNEF